jgi:hypothetical protein
VSRGFQALFVASILVASTAMFALAESRKLDRAPIRALVLSAGPAVAGQARPALFSPTCNCPTSYARIEFRLGKPGALQAWIVSPDGAVVKRIADFRNVRHVSLRWNGRDEEGRLAPDGSYRLRIRTAGSTRTLPVFVVVRTTPPRFHATATPRRLTLNGDGVDDHTGVTWRSPVQLFDVHLIATSDGRRQRVPIFRHSKTYSFQWPRATCTDGSCRVKSPPSAGAWSLSLVAQDQAGNKATVSAGTVQVTR